MVKDHYAHSSLQIISNVLGNYIVLQIQMKATTTKTTDKISSTTFEKVIQTINISSDFPLPLSQIQVFWPAQQGLTYSANSLLHQKPLCPSLLFRCFSSKHWCAAFFPASYEYNTVQEPICKASIESFNHFQGGVYALRFAGNPLPSDDYWTLEIANVFHYYLSFQQRCKDKKILKCHYYCIKVYEI